jgi:hypothetical protein
LWIGKVGADIDTQTAATASSWTIYGLALQYNQDKSTNKPGSEAFAEKVLPLVRDNLHLQPAIAAV